ncbi:hypothetical protein [Hyphomonas sp.]|jgi:RNase P protein component|uniref:hypothetical protein n=1 Tax=Hyphomonas sp. TaxID=87 RepID=UPI0025BE77AC|nr:hypothetical protein [Hyphomonas sp.]|tara:strand:- start:435 stop:602 length:168 start_codon:yes stop_codon:yes gene_type:complete
MNNKKLADHDWIKYAFDPNRIKRPIGETYAQYLLRKKAEEKIVIIEGECEVHYDI